MSVDSGPDPIDELFAQLAGSRRQLRAVMDKVPAMIGYWNRDLLNALANEAYVEWFGMSPDEILGIHIRERLGEELSEVKLPYMQAALGGVAQHFDRTTVHPNPLDQQPPAMDRQASVSVRHEDLRSVEVVRHLHYAGGPPLTSTTVTNRMAEYI